jgi:hypothetical protein
MREQLYQKGAADGKMLNSGRMVKLGLSIVKTGQMACKK